MSEFLTDLRDIRFVLFEQIDIDRVLALPKYASLDRDTLSAVVDEAARFAKEQMAPMNGPSDEVGARYDSKTKQVTMPEGFRETYELYCQNGWLGLSHSTEFGGQGMPYLLHLAADELFFGACLSFCENSLLTTGAAHLIEAFGSDELKNRYVENMYTGKWAGTMCLTEAGAGSDVGACTTRAVPQGGHYLIAGEKVFITGGEHDLTENICHAVLARIEGAPPGTKGISLFLVPKFRVDDDGSLGEPNDVECTGIEHKLGIHGSPTCTLVFGGEGRCQGFLLGQENKGMRQMFQMMNEARISVGLQGAALGNAAYQFALHYASERVQGKHYQRGREPGAKATAIIDHPDVRQMLLWQKAWSEGCRAMLLRTGALVDLAEGSERPDERQHAAALVELLTPICKAVSTDLGFQTTSLAVQVLGGYGYLREYPVEQYLRDVRIASIYEGTNGIQAMDFVGRKLPARGGETLQSLLGIMAELSDAHADHSVLGPEMKTFAAAQQALLEASQHSRRLAPEDAGLLLSNASAMLALAGQVVIGWLLLEQATLLYPRLVEIGREQGIAIDDAAALGALCAQHDEAKYCDGKIKVAQFFARRALALCPAQAAVLQATDRSVVDAVL